jgi:preprotein translocase subunit YajC
MELNPQFLASALIILTVFSIFMYVILSRPTEDKKINND